MATWLSRLLCSNKSRRVHPAPLKLYIYMYTHPYYSFYCRTRTIGRNYILQHLLGCGPDLLAAADASFFERDARAICGPASPIIYENFLPVYRDSYCFRNYYSRGGGAEGEGGEVPAEAHSGCAGWSANITHGSTLWASKCATGPHRWHKNLLYCNVCLYIPVFVICTYIDCVYLYIQQLFQTSSTSAHYVEGVVDKAWRMRLRFIQFCRQKLAKYLVGGGEPKVWCPYNGFSV